MKDFNDIVYKEQKRVEGLKKKPIRMFFNKYTWADLWRTVDFILMVIAIAATIWFFTGCYTPNKAEQQASKAMVKYPARILPLFRGQFPCITTAIETKTDSAAFKAWQDSVEKVRSFYEELLNGVVPDTVHDTKTVVDSARCNDLLVKYRENDKKHVQKENILSSQVADLQSKLKSIPPVNNNTVKTVEDSSKIKLLMLQINDKDYLILSLQDKNEKKGKWIMWLLVLLLASGVVNLLQFKRIL